MALVFNFLILDILAASLAITFGILMYYKRAFKYWKKRGVPYIIPPRIPFGCLPNSFRHKIYIGNHLKTMYAAGKLQGYKHGADFVFHRPAYMPIDVQYIKNILQRDFDHFSERGFYYNQKDDPLSANLFALGGDKWRFLRGKLSPTFTPGKLKMMFGNLLQCANQMQDEIEKMCKNKKEVNIKDISECFIIDVIGSCAFGLDCNCFKNPEGEFKKQGRKIFSFSRLRILKTGAAFAFPNCARWLGIKLFENESIEFFLNLVKTTIQYREAHNVTRKDFLQLLLELRNGPGNDDCFTIEEITAQVFIFFAAGFETSSITLAFCLYELASNLDVQEKLREEIMRVLVIHGGEISYDTIADMKYMNQVVDETLRKYPPVSFITRICEKDYQMPGTETIIQKGIGVVVSILGLHHDPDYYPDPEKFNPERFSDENKKRRVPFTYIPFGEGPRLCIGLRFGLMQVKMGLVVLLKKYKFLLNTQTAVPLQMDPFSFTLTPQEGIFLDVERVTDFE